MSSEKCFPGWILDETTGSLTAFQLERKDAGDYTCIAENNAGRLEATAYLNVIIKPRVQRLQLRRSKNYGRQLLSSAE